MRNVFSAALSRNLGLHCCLRSAFLSALCHSWYVSCLSSFPFLRTVLKKLHSFLQKIEMLISVSKKKKRKKHISQQTLPSSSHMVSDSCLAEIHSTPSVF